MRIGLVVDSCCDLPRDYLDREGVIVLPISVRIGDHLHVDERDPWLTQAFYEHHLDQKAADFAESIPFSAEEIERLFLDRLVMDFDYVFCLTVTERRSPIYENANRASLSILAKYRQRRKEAGLGERFGLAVVSTRNLFAGQAVPAVEVLRLAREGASPSEIGARIKRLVDQTHTYLVPADLFFIYKRAARKGDRSIGWGSYTVGQWLDMKPILHCNVDETRTVAKVKGFESGVSRVFDNVVRQVEMGLSVPVVCISYGGPLDQVARLPGYARLSAVAADRGVRVMLSPMSQTAAINVGPGALSVALAAPHHVFH